MSAQNENIILDHMNLMFKEMNSIFMKWSEGCDTLENIISPNENVKHSKEIDIQTDDFDTVSTASTDYVRSVSVET